MKKEMKQILWVVALFVILMTATGNLVSAAGFDWSDVSGAVDKLTEEQAELSQALASADMDRILDEAGDLLFACVNVVRHAGVDSEEALRFATDKFQARFTEVETLVSNDGFRMEELPLEALDRYWDRVKQK